MLLEQYQTPDDQGVVGEGPDVDAIPFLQPPNEPARPSAESERALNQNVR
jgi:hypothetical protein